MSNRTIAEQEAYDQGQEDGYSKGWAAGNEHEDELDAEIAKLKARIKELEGGQHGQTDTDKPKKA